jgi:hypothetical protein
MKDENKDGTRRLPKNAGKTSLFSLKDLFALWTWIHAITKFP